MAGVKGLGGGSRHCHPALTMSSLVAISTKSFKLACMDLASKVFILALAGA